MILRIVTTFTLLAFAINHTALAADVDVGMRPEGGQIVTAGFDHSTSTFVGDTRVFSGGLTLDVPSNTVFGDEPGFGAPANTFASSGTLNIVVRSSLRYFSGANFNNITFNTTSTRLDISNDLGTFTPILSPLVDPANPDAADPLRTAPVPFIAGLELDTHLTWTLIDNVPIAEGFYLIELDARLNGFTPSLPFWVVLAYGDSFTDAQIDDVNDAVAATFIPSPSAMTALALLGVTAARRRR